MTKAFDIIQGPIITEKTMALKENFNKYTFKVAKSANKVEIKNAFESIFGVKVKQVNTSHVRGRSKRVGRYSGTTSSYKKAIITLAERQSLDLLKENQ